MKIVSLRMSEDVWEAVQAEALRSGISASEFIREAAIFRLGYRWALRENDGSLAEQLRQVGVMPPSF